MIVNYLAALVGAVLAVAIMLFGSYCVGGWVVLLSSPSYSYNDIPDLTGKVALVTGSNTGIGFVTVRELAKKGATVIATTRSMEKGENALKAIDLQLSDIPTKGKVEFLPLDLASFKNVKEFTKIVRSKYRQIDILILNAGVMFLPFNLTENGLETQIATNHFGHFILVKNLMSLLKKSKARIVTVTSWMHYVHYYVKGSLNFDSFTKPDTYNKFQAYGQSKLANILFANELARQLNGTGVTSNSVHPGSIQTGLMQPLKESIIGSGESFFSNVILRFSSIFERGILMNAYDGAKTQIYVATSPKVAGLTGKYFEPIGIMTTPSSYARNVTLQKVLWEKSEQLTKGYW